VSDFECVPSFHSNVRKRVITRFSEVFTCNYTQTAVFTRFGNYCDGRNHVQYCILAVRTVRNGAVVFLE